MKKIFNQTISSSFSTILLGTFTLFISLSLPFNTWGQKCKPDYSKLDKIEKKQIDVWTAELYETSFGASMMKTSTVSIVFFIGRMDTLNFVKVQLQKQEESVTNAVLESSLKGAMGNEFYFGLKDGDPLKFTASKATNETKANGLSGKLVTTVTLSSEIKSEDIQKIKDALTGKVIDAVRVKLENGLIIDQNVKEKKGDKMKEKSVCFCNFLQEKGYMK
jgi:hypothetical protein